MVQLQHAIVISPGQFDQEYSGQFPQESMVRFIRNQVVNFTGISNYLTGLDNFGYNYPLRALIAGAYLGGNGEKEAVYPASYTDAEGKPLNGNKKYQLKFTKAPPVDAFWSLTMYDATNKMLVDNPIQRYKIGSGTKGMKINDDGSFTIVIQNDMPAGADKNNWLPAPKDGFYLMLRMYQPKDEIISGAYPLPQLITKN